MEFRHSLGQRIMIVFALMTALVAGVFALGIVATIHVVEKRLVSTSLDGSLQRILLLDDQTAWRPQPERDERFFAADGAGELALPADVARLPPGFSEVTRDGKAWYAMTRVVNGRTYVLLRDQQGFDQRERVLFAVVITGFVLSVGLALLLGWGLARRVLAPVTRLARQVRHRDQLLALAPPLAPDYAVDEVGELARSFDQTLGRLRTALGREKLFTGDVSHELRTPLMVLASSSELLLANPRLGQRDRQQVIDIACAVRDLRELVEKLLQRARSDGENASAGPKSL